MLNDGYALALAIYSKLCLEAVRECGPEADTPTIEKAVRRMMDALPADEREAVADAVKALTSYGAPEFHLHGSH